MTKEGLIEHFDSIQRPSELVEKTYKTENGVCFQAFTESIMRCLRLVSKNSSEILYSPQANRPRFPHFT